MVICTFNGVKCVSCCCRLRAKSNNNKTNQYRKWHAIPSDLRFAAWKRKAVLDLKHGICSKCIEEYRENKRILIYGLKEMNRNLKHSGGYTAFIHKLWQKDQKLIEELKRYNKKVLAEIETLKKDLDRLVISTDGLLRTSIKYKHKKLVKFKTAEEEQAFYDEEIEKIPQYQDNTAKYFNNVDYKLLSNNDCYTLTGFTKKEIIEQARICKVSPIQIFHCRVRIRYYLPYQLQSILFGFSVGWLTNNFHEIVPILNKHYAKPVLISDCADYKQFWNPTKIHNEHTPVFAYAIRDIDPQTDKTNIFTQDGTYQYIYNVQTDHEIRKLSQCHWKNNQALIKVHIWACADGSPLYVAIYPL